MGGEVVGGWGEEGRYLVGGRIGTYLGGDWEGLSRGGGGGQVLSREIGT